MRLSKVLYSFYFTVDACKDKWKNLRDTFNRQHKKISSKKSGQAAEQIKPWKFYNSMLFLERSIVRRQTCSNLLDVDPELDSDTDNSSREEGKTSEQSVNSADICETVEIGASSSTKTAEGKTQLVGQRRKRRKSDYLEEQMIEIAKKLNEPEPIDEPEDDVTHFLKSLEPSLRSLPPYKKSLAKIKIQTVLHEMMYDNTSMPSGRPISEVEFGCGVSGGHVTERSNTST